MSDRFNFRRTPLKDLYCIERNPIGDNRGFLSRFFCAKEFEEIGFKGSIAQMNHTLTNLKGCVRGLHFQHPPSAETKIVTCIKGKVFDVAVDVRSGSPTFLNWYAIELSAENRMSLYIPKGFAHGFQTLENDCELLYIHSEFYQPKAEDALNALDKKIAIDWPLDVTEMSERDRSHKMINNFEGIKIK